jgi:hypothetical protein
MTDVAKDTTQLQNAVRSFLSAVEPEESVALAPLVYFYNGRHDVYYNGRILSAHVAPALKFTACFTLSDIIRYCTCTSNLLSVSPTLATVYIWAYCVLSVIYTSVQCVCTRLSYTIKTLKKVKCKHCAMETRGRVDV